LISAFLINSLAAFKNNREKGRGEARGGIWSWRRGLVDGQAVRLMGSSVRWRGSSRCCPVSRELGRTGPSSRRELLPGVSEQRRWRLGSRGLAQGCGTEQTAGIRGCQPSPELRDWESMDGMGHVPGGRRAVVPTSSTM